jgi:serine/threonine protein kinase/Flp pilus assembly protein TadD
MKGGAARWNRTMAEAPSDPQHDISPALVLTPPPREESDAGNLAARLSREMAERWEEGDRVITEEFLAEYPELWDHPEAAIEVIYEETCLRREFGEEVDRKNLLDRFPQWRTQLEILLDSDLIPEPKPEPLFPNVGETLGEFRMLAELGRGGQGYVFLACQPSLSDRPVVLKLTACDDGREHLSLARLQHTHIVPLYSVETFPDRNLRALCMPYFGSATLRQILDELADIPLARRTGRHLFDALGRIQERIPVRLPTRGPVRQMLARANYVDAIAWVGASLAEALQYAHDRELIHLDLKPSNVLLAVDGQPMLLDFHLTQKPIHPEDPLPDWLGGTPVYMSPEQKAAVAAAQNGQPVPVVVDGRADLYALGVMLYEALGGQLPYRPGESPPLFRCNPLVSVGLSDIIHKCLAPAAAERYAQAAHLAADLQRHLTHRRLLGVHNRSLLERWRKWRCRQPYTFPLVALFLVCLVVAGVAGSFQRVNLEQQREQARVLLERSQEYLQQGNYRDAFTALHQGLALSDGPLNDPDLRKEFQTALRRAELGQTVRDLHQFARRVRFLYGVDGLPRANLRALEEGCRPFWAQRRLILERLGQQAIPGANPRQIRTDLLDLAILWTDLRVRLAAPDEAASVRREALEVLAQAEELFGPSAVLCYERQHYAAALGLAKEETPAVLTPASHTAWEHYALGRSFLRAGQLERAAAELTEAVRQEPGGFWPNFYRGMCAYRLEHYGEAVEAFNICIGASSDSAACFYNRGLANTAREHLEEARIDYDHALKLDPRLAQAAVNRGMIYYRQQHYPEAAADWQRALELGADPATLHYYLALVHEAQGRRSEALTCLQRALAANPAHEEARALQRRLSPSNPKDERRQTKP